MKTFRFFFYFLPILGLLLANPVRTFADNPSSSTTQSPNAAIWMEKMKTMLPTVFCKDQSYFRECFKVTAEECEKEAIRVTRICVDSMKEDIEKNLAKDGGRKWGQNVGRCAGQSYEFSLRPKWTDTPRCKDPSLWTQ